jgi:hypothetical protein
MKRKFQLSVLLVFLVFSVRAQIINIESLRLASDSLGFFGSENLNFSVVQNTQQSFNITNNLALQYRGKRHIYLLFSNLAFNFSEAVSFQRNGFAHFRYGYSLNKWLIPEALVQYQIDVPLRIAQRLLLGAGPRFKLLKTKYQKLFTGHLVLFENDKELDNNIEHQNVRLSSYVVYELKTTEKFRWTSTIYYQPRLDDFEDFRISAQSQFQLGVLKNLQFIITASANYDAFPVQDPSIPNLTYTFTNGLLVTF